MSHTPQSWKELREDEREAIMEWASLSPERRGQIIRAAENIAWWDGFYKRAGRWKMVATVAVGVATVIAIVAIKWTETDR